MDDSIIYRKTRRGATELAATHGTLSHAARRVLILLNGERTLSELAELFGSDTVEHIVTDLEAQGFARQIDPGEAVETTQAIPTLTGPTLVGDLRLVAHEPPPPARRASAWIAMGLFVAAIASAGGYWFVWRPNHTGSAAMAGARDAVSASAEQGGSTRVDAQPIVRELPLSGLPAVTVSATPAAKAAAASAADEAAGAEDAGAVVPASAAAIVPAAASVELPAPSRRASQQPATGAGAKPAPPSEAESPPAPSPPAGARPPPAAVASASSTRIEQTAVDAPAAEATSSIPTGASDREASPAARSVPVAAGAAPPGTSAGGAPAEQLAALTPSTRPKSGPAQLHPRKHDPPEFPGRALRARVLEGRVLAHVWITAEGTVEQVDIVKATPTRLFDDEVKRALSLWTFDPPGRPADTTVELDSKQ
jgi:periplasmic protein TonB